MSWLRPAGARQEPSWVSSSSLVVNGGIYYVKDAALTLPPNDDREIHETRRPVIVLSGPSANSNRGWLFVLVAPISSSTSRKTHLCVKLSAGEGGLSKKGWVRTAAIQPLLKEDLSDQLGVVNAERLEQIHARLFQYMGLIDDLPAEEPNV